MKKTKFILPIAIGTVLLAAISPTTSTDQSAKTSIRSYTTSTESSESIIARDLPDFGSDTGNLESDWDNTEAVISESSEEIVNATDNVPIKSSAETPVEMDYTLPTVDQEQVNEPISQPPISEEPKVVVEESTTVPNIQETSPVSEPTTDSNTENHGGNGENFNKYDNQEQQNTTELVLNTHTKKIHNPWCNSVPKIAPENYETTTLSIAELEAQGYVKCKQKGDW